jgi:hypothetical protein
MREFLDAYGNNIGVIVGILGFLVVIITKSEDILRIIKKIVENLDRVSLLLFKVVAIATSGSLGTGIAILRNKELEV